MRKKIEDFGEKLGGARKDLWKNGIEYWHLNHMTDDEIIEYVNRNSVFPLPNAIKQVEEEGYSAFAAYSIREFRKCVNDLQSLSLAKEYVTEVCAFRNTVLAIKTDEDVYRFIITIDKQSWNKEYIDIFKLRKFYYYFKRHERKCLATNFPYLKKKSSSRKSAFIPPKIERCQRTGKDILRGRNVGEKLWQQTFSFRGVEFGNWTGQKYRQISLNMAYEALYDLAEVLGIESTDIAFSGDLGLGFGSRGHSNAAAHYEPDREVINLTKMWGAGCLAHEWAHALDDKIGKYYGISERFKLASESNDTSKLPKSFNDLVYALKWNPDGTPTNYYINSKEFDKKFRKDAHGYWSSTCEMFARAFACYIKDIANFRSDYLFAQADVFILENPDGLVCAIPQGIERERINMLLSIVISDLINEGFFTKRRPERAKRMTRKKKTIEFVYELQEDEDGQLLLPLY